MTEPTNGVLEKQIELLGKFFEDKMQNVEKHIQEIKEEVHEHILQDNARLTHVERWIWMVTGVIIFMNTIFVPIAIWGIIQILGKAWH